VTDRAGQGGAIALSPPDSFFLDDVYGGVSAYYTAKLARHGAIPLGVDWACEATQRLRFVKLLKICAFDAPVSVNDLGCGYGALAVFLAERYPAAAIDYVGIDLAPVMIQRARRRHRGKPLTRFVVGRTIPRQADYAVASGIMNVKLEQPLDLWEAVVRTTLDDMHRTSRIGFAVNFLGSPNPDAPPDQLYCPPPETWARYCERALGCSVEILSDYGMREYTLLVRRPPIDSAGRSPPRLVPL
jgi:SAM-dependent methyltransferase